MKCSWCSHFGTFFSYFSVSLSPWQNISKYIQTLQIFRRFIGCCMLILLCKHLCLLQLNFATCSVLLRLASTAFESVKMSTLIMNVKWEYLWLESVLALLQMWVWVCLLFNDAACCWMCTASVIDQWMSMEHLWNDVDRKNSQYSGENLLQRLFLNHKTYLDYSGVEISVIRLVLTWKFCGKLLINSVAVR
jgi:hypothetical protein